MANEPSGPGQSMSRLQRQNLSDSALRACAADEPLRGRGARQSIFDRLAGAHTASSSSHVRRQRQASVEAFAASRHSGASAPPASVPARGRSSLHRPSSTGSLARRRSSCSTGQEANGGGGPAAGAQRQWHGDYITKVNVDPIPLRGKGLRSTQTERDEPEGNSACSSPVSASATSATSAAVRAALVAEVRAAVAPMAVSRRPTPLVIDCGESATPTVCSIATPTSEATLDSSRAGYSTSQLQRQLQDTRHKLLALEVEQRKLIETSLGALAGTPEAGTNCQTFPLSEAGSPSASPGRSVAPEALDYIGGLCLGPGRPDAERLKDENRLLREAVSMATIRNNELMARREAAETRSRLLESEIRHAAQALGGDGVTGNHGLSSLPEDRSSVPEIPAAGPAVVQEVQIPNSAGLTAAMPQPCPDGGSVQG